MSDFGQEDEKPSVKTLEFMFQKALTCWNNLELNKKGDPEWPSLLGTELYETCKIKFCNSVLDTKWVEVKNYFGYNPLEAGFYMPTEQQISTEIMFVDFLLMYLADELGYEFVEFTENTSSFAEETKNV